ncbi:MAG: GspE/PulE family protein [Opitutus sp.]
MFEGRDQAIYEVLVAQRRVPVEQLDQLREELRATGSTLADGLVRFGFLSLDQLLAAIADSLGCKLAGEIPSALSAELLGRVSGETARNYGVLPVAAAPGRIEVVSMDPFSARIADDLAFVLGSEVQLLVGDPSVIAGLIKRYYGDDESTLAELLREVKLQEGASGNAANLCVDDLEAMAGQTPVIRLVNLFLGQAIRDHASDVHFEPFEHEFKVRCRVDGVLYEMSPPPRSLALSIASRIKVLANLNIAERRLPQDGRMRLTISGRAVDLRVSTLPTQFGESVVLRVLDQSAVQLRISDLGMAERVVEGVQEMVRRPNGIFVVTGPTGCGKTTTLYSALRIINTPDIKVLTAEDPVEFEVDGLVQVPVNPAFGVTFAATLRSFLRQDPDVIMVGEIRDVDTAQIAVQASLTGHLVLSTLHTNDAAGAVTRLTDMGVEPFLIASTLEAVLAQRLVRKICLRCIRADEGATDANGIRCEENATYSGGGCVHCAQSGYRGRTGIYEWLRMSEALRDAVVERAPTLIIRQRATERGMETLRECGLGKVRAGITTVAEVLKYT